ncbi:hypothetical protein FSP39_006064 [Pinctada imbricata]|uniref:Carbonic anhydrase n=1 Tax=Pinctada imbricata TaxID=66713 RepID=A0AA88YWN4_PINIB|nr:hypothetical protein FSP39_006064 [Pinctada imbricata]
MQESPESPTDIQTGQVVGTLSYLKGLDRARHGVPLSQSFKFLNLSTIFREDFPGTRDAQIGSEFDYNPSSPRGPHTWNILWPGCNGILQSPININTSRVIYERPFQINYNLENLVISGDFLNNGHSCAFYPSRKLRAMYGVPHAEREMYILDEIHFHFGNDLQHGSEHSMNNLFFPVEIHLVHYNSRYENAKNASKYRDGLVALGVFMEVGFGPPTELDRFISTYVPRIAIPDNVGVPAILDINSILPYNRDLFTYYGSKTTPPCTHNIRWILMRTHKTITSQSHRLLYYLRNHENQRISRYGNFRPVQDSTCRMVEANFRNS